MAFVSRNWELYCEEMEGEINSLDINVKKYGKGNTSCMDKVLRENREDVAEFNACYNNIIRLGAIITLAAWGQ